MKYESSVIVLPSRLRLLHVPSASSETVTVALTGKVGRRAELPSEIGAAHFLEHLFFDGTAKRPNAAQLNQFLEDQGGVRNGNTGAELVNYFAKVLVDKAETAFEFIADIFFDSRLATEDIEKERKVIGHEASARRDNPSDLLPRTTLSTLYPGQAIGRTIYDEEANLPKMDRETLMGYMGRSYVRDNFILTVSGGISEAEATTLAGRYFDRFNAGSAVSFESPALQGGHFVNIVRKDFSQSCFAVSYRGIPWLDPRQAAVNLLAAVLGRSASSRLYQKLRHEHHLAYRLSSYPVSFSDVGHFTIAAYVKEEDIRRSLEVIFKEAKLLMEDGITSAELDRAKNICLSDLLFRMEDVHERASSLAGQLAANGRYQDIDEYIGKIKNVQREDVLDAARYIFSDEPKINILTKTPEGIDLDPSMWSS